jgi:predicted ATPase
VSTKKNADAAVALAQDQNFRLMLAWARVYEGWADAHLGQCERGLSQIESGIDAVRKMGTDQSLSHLLGMKGDVCLLFNLHEEGLQAVEQGLEVVARTSERYYEPELRRLRGKLQLGRTDGCREAAEHDFNESLTVARAQGAKLFELRAAIGLGAIWSLEGRAAEAIDMVEQASRDIADQLPESDRIDLEAFTKESLKR